MLILHSWLTVHHCELFICTVRSSFNHVHIIKEKVASQHCAWGMKPCVCIEVMNQTTFTIQIKHIKWQMMYLWSLFSAGKTLYASWITLSLLNRPWYHSSLFSSTAAPEKHNIAKPDSEWYSHTYLSLLVFYIYILIIIHISPHLYQIILGCCSEPRFVHAWKGP